MTEYVLGEVPEGAGERAFRKKAPEVKLKVVQVPPLPVGFGERPKATAKPYKLAEATRHAQMIEQAWRRAGHDVRAEIITETKGGKTTYRVVMPDLINGLPKKEVC
jgi:hypothetical protein